MIFTNFCLIFCRSVAFCRTVLFFVGRDGLRHFGQAVFLSIFFLFNLLNLQFFLIFLVYFCRTVAFVGRFFVGRWVAMVLTSSSCNLGIDYQIIDSWQVPPFFQIRCFLPWSCIFCLCLISSNTLFFFRNDIPEWTLDRRFFLICWFFFCRFLLTSVWYFVGRLLFVGRFCLL